MNKEIDKEFDETKNILENIKTDVAIEYATWSKEKAK